MRLLTFFGKLKKLDSPITLRRVVGHSMVPVLPPGIHVYGWRWYKELKPGQVVIFEHEGREKIKRIDQIKNNKIYVLGDHEDSSADSRHFGWLDLDSVVAIVIWPRANKV